MLRNLMKKTFAFVMAFLFSVLPTVSAMAASEDVIDTSKVGSITIHKYDMTAAEADGVDLSQFTANGEEDTAAETALADYAIKGVEFTYLRVGDVEQQSKNGSVILMYEIPDELQTILGLDSETPQETIGTKDYFTSTQINDALAKALEDNTATKDALEAYISTSSNTNAVAMDETDANGYTTATNLDLGLYLIVETKVPEDVVYTTNPWFVQIPMTNDDGDYWFYDIDCYPKNETGVPTLDKKVRNNPDSSNVTTSSTDSTFTSDREEYTYQDTVTASEGEVLDYKFVSKLPRVTSTASYLTTYTFVDTLTKGIEYNKDVVVAIYDNATASDSTNVNNVSDSGALAVWTSSDSTKMFNVTYGTAADDATTMTVELTAAGLKEINTKYSEQYIVVYYTATVNSDASMVTGDNGNPNDVTLTWKRTSTNYYDELKDECVVYTFGIDLTKKFTDDGGDPTKVQFVIQNTSDLYFVVAEKESDGVYYVTGKSATEDGATQFSPASDGTLIINGIEADTYDLTETHSDDGYSLLKKAITVTITSTSAEITPTEANITGIQTKSEVTTNNTSTSTGDVIADDVVVTTTSASATVDDEDASMISCIADDSSENALVVLEVTNSKAFLLPQTGDKGIYLLTIAGMLILACGIAVMRKKNENDQTPVMK